MRKNIRNTIAAVVCSLLSVSVYGQIPSTFSLQNTYVRMPQGYNDFNKENTGVVGSSDFGKVIRFNDGSWFKGSTSNGRPCYGTLHETDGTKIIGHFDSNVRLTDVGMIEWPDGSWYYGNFKNGKRHGEGSQYNSGDGTYYDLVYDYESVESLVEVEEPKYNKQLYNQMLTAGMDAKSSAQLSERKNSYSSSSSKSKRRFTTAEINRQADVTARAYEEFKKNPSSHSHGYYLSSKKLLDMMQGR